MLLKFWTHHFKIFDEPIALSLVPAPKQKDLFYSILSEQVDRKSVKALCSSVLYGANGSGKSALIEAVGILQNMVIHGNLLFLQKYGKEWINRSKGADVDFDFTAGRGRKKQSTEFGVKFIQNGRLFRYCLSVEPAYYANQFRSFRVFEEKLAINDKPVFERIGDDLRLFWTMINTELEHCDTDGKRDFLESIARHGLRETDLFLCNGFSQLMSPDLFDEVDDWFRNKLIVLTGQDETGLAACRKRKQVRLDLPDRGEDFESVLSELLVKFGISEDSIQTVLRYSLGYPTSDSDHQTDCPIENLESSGTLRFARLMPVILSALIEGGTIICDELDRSIHPGIVMKLIKCFHDDTLNLNHAQLVFSTQNPVYMNPQLLRRDEIKLIDRDEQGNREISSLADFRTSGPHGIRAGDDYMSLYLQEMLGGFPRIQFSDQLRDFVKGSGQPEE